MSKKEKQKKSKQKEKKYRMDIQPIPGTRDWFPEDMRLRNWLIKKWHDTAITFGFEEYDAPILEPASLYMVKSGDEICSQMYHFMDNSKKHITLRPEMTPTLARLILKRGKKMLFPAKWYSVPQCWRWETTTKGRTREFYQWNMDVIGIKTISGEAECVASLIYFLQSVGLTCEDACVRLSSRKILESFIKSLKTPNAKNDFLAICNCIDKYEKVAKKIVIEILMKKGVKKVNEGSDLDVVIKKAGENGIEWKKKSLEVLKELFEEKDELKDIEDEKLDKVIEFVSTEGVEGLQKLAGENKEMLNAIDEVMKFIQLMEDGYGMKGWVLFDTSIIRGLTYYDGIVFEAFAKKGLQRAIAGGGRYDSLLNAFGEKQSVPACGYGLGDVVIIEILKALKKLPSFERKVDDFIIPFNPSFQVEATKIAMMLRKKGRVVDVAMKRYKKIKQAFSVADRIGAERVIYVAPDEFKEGKVVVKKLRMKEGEEGKQTQVLIKDL